MNDAIPGEVVRRSDTGPGLGDRGNIRGAFSTTYIERERDRGGEGYIHTCIYIYIIYIYIYIFICIYIKHFYIHHYRNSMLHDCSDS